MKIQVAWTIIAVSTCTVASDALSFSVNRPGRRLVKASSASSTADNLPLYSVNSKAENDNHEKFSSDILNLRGGDASVSSSSPKALSWNKNLGREMLAELIGTFLLVFIGTASVSSSIFTDSLLGLFQVASVWIIAVTIAICATASISGAHLNPAISIAFAMVRPSKSFNWRKVIPYSISQLGGAILGSWLNLVLYSSTIAAFETKNGIIRSGVSGLASARAFGEYFVSPVTTVTAFLAESIGTCILAFVIFALTHPKNDTMKSGFVPPLIGLTVGALISIIAPLTQAGFNPARDFGPRIVAWFAGWKTVAFTSSWVYIIAPIVGASIGAALVDRVLYADDDAED